VGQKAENKSRDSALYNTVKKFWGDFWKECRRAIASMQRRYVNMFIWVKAHLFAAAVILVATVMLGPLLAWLAAIFRRLYIRVHCRQLLRAARENLDADPDAAILMAYRAARKILQLVGMQRMQNIDLFDYAARLRRIDPCCGHAAAMVFFLYSRIEYGGKKATPAQAAAALNAALELQTAAPCLKRLLPLSASDQIPPAANNGRNPCSPPDAKP